MRHISIDREIIKECKAGNMLMFRELVLRASPHAFSLAFRMLNDEELSRDAVQESMIKVWKKLGYFNENSHFMTWLYRIVFNTCIDQLRKMKRNREYRLDDRGWDLIRKRTGEGQASALENREAGMILRSLTARLGPAQKAVFVMSELMGLGHDQIAGITGMGKSAVKSNLYHARKTIEKNLKKCLE